MTPLHRRLLVLTAVAVVALLVLQWLVRTDPTERNYEAFTEMVYSLAGETQAASAALPGGLVQQPLQPGVVVRGHAPFRYGEGPEEAQRAGRELASPFAPDDEDARAAGAELYRIFCVACHGATGDGQGPVTRRGVPGPPSLSAARALAMADGELFHVLTRGQGTMASYEAQLTPEDRWRVILHVRALQEGTR